MRPAGGAGGHKHTYRADIDGLRAAAIIPVVLFHLGTPGFGGGYVGVDVFFVISGFLITSIILPEVRENRFSFAEFYERRARRLFPALFVVLAVSSVAAAALLIPSDLRSFGQSLVATTLFAANILFWRSAGYFDGPAEMKPLLHTWSLAVEEQFYIFFPIILIALCRWFPHRLKLAISLIATLSFAASVAWLGDSPKGVFYLTSFRAWELMLGVLLAIGAFPPVRSNLARSTLALLALGAITYAVASYSATTPFPGASALAPTLGTALLIHIGASGSSAVNRALSMKPLVHIGLISYPLYLWHWPLIVFLKYFLIRDLTLLERAAVVVASFILADLTFRFVERPFRSREKWTRKQLFPASAAAAVVLLTIGVTLVMTRGLPGRLSEAERVIAAAKAEGTVGPDCYSDPRASRNHIPECPIGVVGEPEFLVWGDSHAMAMFPAFDSAGVAAQRSGRFTAHAGCPPLLGTARYDREGEDCVAYNDRVIASLERTPSIREVFLVARWALNANGLRYGDEGGQPALLSHTGIEGNARAFRDGMERTIRELVARGLVVTVVTQVPEIGWDVPSRLTRASRFNRPAPEPPTRTAYRERQRIVNEVLDQLSQEIDFDVVAVERLFCPADECRIVADGRSLYRDGDHLSRAGALLLFPLITQSLGSS